MFYVYWNESMVSTRRCLFGIVNHLTRSIFKFHDTTRVVWQQSNPVAVAFLSNSHEFCKELSSLVMRMRRLMPYSQFLHFKCFLIASNATLRLLRQPAACSLQTESYENIFEDSRMRSLQSDERRTSRKSPRWLRPLIVIGPVVYFAHRDGYKMVSHRWTMRWKDLSWSLPRRLWTQLVHNIHFKHWNYFINLEVKSNGCGYLQSRGNGGDNGSKWFALWFLGGICGCKRSIYFFFMA